MKTSRPICSDDAERITKRAGDEQRGHRQVDRGAVQIERVPGGDHHPDGRAVDAEVLHLGDQSWQRRLRGGRRDDEQVFAGQIPHQLEDGDPDTARSSIPSTPNTKIAQVR